MPSNPSDDASEKPEAPTSPATPKKSAAAKDSAAQNKPAAQKKPAVRNKSAAQSKPKTAADPASAGSPYGPAETLQTPVPPVVPAATVSVPPPAGDVSPPPPPHGVQPPAPYGSQPLAPYGTVPARPSTTLSLLSMIFGIVGLALSCCYGGGGLFAAAGVVLGHIARRKREPAQGMSLTGLITGYIGVSISLAWLIFAIVMVVFSITAATQYSTYGY